MDDAPVRHLPGQWFAIDGRYFGPKHVEESLAKMEHDAMLWDLGISPIAPEDAPEDR